MQIESLTYSDKLWQAVAEYAQNCSWKAGGNLAKQMKEGQFSDWERVFAVFDDDHIAGYCTFAKTDCIPDVSYTPYIGFMLWGSSTEAID
ncbi:hypothetical protein [Paenibacillus massiliensis]|uniref:hypothetical protein n=1 Tax=Paenibacillus massiliensis TaxID=225917 RepID=UPI001B7F9286|nr:hypothetical protein [Paenibacillus massiliensis]